MIPLVLSSDVDEAQLRDPFFTNMFMSLSSFPNLEGSMHIYDMCVPLLCTTGRQGTYAICAWRIKYNSRYGVKPLMHQSELRTYESSPFSKRNSYHFVALWKLLNGMDKLKLIIEVQYIGIILSPNSYFNTSMDDFIHDL